MSEELRLNVYIDASNVWQTQKVKGRMFDLAKLAVYLKNTYKASSVRCYYYTAYPANGTRAYSLDKKHKFYTYLTKALGFVVRKKELKRIYIQAEEGMVFQEKGNMDVEMTIDALHDLPNYDAALFFSGDSDFLPLISYLRNAGKKIYVYSSKNNVSSELRTGADGYVDILTIKEDIWGNEVRHRDQK